MFSRPVGGTHITRQTCPRVHACVALFSRPVGGTHITRRTRPRVRAGIALFSRPVGRTHITRRTCPGVHADVALFSRSAWWTYITSCPCPRVGALVTCVTRPSYRAAAYSILTKFGRTLLGVEAIASIQTASCRLWVCVIAVVKKRDAVPVFINAGRVVELTVRSTPQEQGGA